MENNMKNIHTRWNITKNVKTVCDAIIDNKLNAKQTTGYINAVNRLKEYFSASEQQVWILCYSIWYYFEENGTGTTFQEFANFLSTNVLNVVALNKDFLFLKKLNLLEFDEGDSRFGINKELIKCIIRNERFNKIEDNSISYSEFLGKFSQKFESRKYNNKDCFEIIEELLEFEDQYEKIELVKKIKRHIPFYLDRFLYYEFCNDFLYGGDSGLERTLADIFEGFEKTMQARMFLDGTHKLIKDNLVEFVTMGNLSDSTITLTEAGKKLFLGNDYDLYETKIDKKNQILPEDIIQKDLFFDDKTQK